MTPGAIRQVEAADLPDIVRLVEACGFPERTVAGWRWVLFENPDQGDIAPGWVFERSGRVAGFLGNFVNRYRDGATDFTIATGHTVVSELTKNGHQAGVSLIRHGINQPGVDAYVTLNNNALSARLIPRLGGSAWLGKAGRTWAEWVFRPDRIARAWLPCEADRERFSGVAGGGLDVSGRRGGILFLPLEAVSEEQLAPLMPPECFSRRFSAAALRYRLSDPDRAGGMAYVVALSGTRVLALAAVLLTKPTPEGLDHAEISDWAGSPCEEGIAAQAALLRHTVSVARRAGASRLRLHFPDHLPAEALSAAGPHLRRHHGHDPCNLLARHPGLARWQPLPGDTDYFFAFRIPPVLFRNPGMAGSALAG